MKLLLLLTLCFFTFPLLAQEPTPPLELTNSDENISNYKEVDEKPHFPGCEDLADSEERRTCADQKMLEFIYFNIGYPAEARKNKIEGMVVIKIIIEKDGSIANAEIVRDIGGGCGQETLRMVKAMPNWIPGKLDGNPVRVQYHIPVKFKLE